jgi:hypothetical protein
MTHLMTKCELPSEKKEDDITKNMNLKVAVIKLA